LEKGGSKQIVLTHIRPYGGLFYKRGCWIDNAPPFAQGGWQGILKMKKREFFILLGMLAMLFSAARVFTQEVAISPWGYGLETSLGVISGDELFSNYSVSIQGLHDFGYGLSLDWIHEEGKYENRGGLLVGSGLLGSAFLGFPISKFFIPYAGGGLGIQSDGEDISFAWKVDAGIAAWLSGILYIKAGVTYDNIREDLGISAGVGFKVEKNVTAVYRNSDGSTFRRTFTKYLWQDNSTPNYVYGDKFESSELVRTYQKTMTSSSYIPAQYELKTSGGEKSTTTLRDRNGQTIGTATTTTPRKTETVKAKDAEITTRYYVYNVTVTRNWYTRTYYYKDRAPTTSRVYQDTESAVLVNSFSETEKR
jgi:hypothetical protein